MHGIDFKIMFLARPEEGGFIVIRRRSIMKPKNFILKTISKI
jgi:hypothetical protein